MDLVYKFILAVILGWGLSRTEKPIHKLEKGLAGNAGLNDWYLIMRYTIGLANADLFFFAMALRDERLKKHARYIWLLLIFRAFGIGSGVALGFLKHGAEDFGG